MMGYAGAEETEKYKKYIQKRRVSTLKESKVDDAPNKAEETGATGFGARAEADPYSFWSEKEKKAFSFGETVNSEHSSSGSAGFEENGSFGPESTLPALRRQDNGLYKKLYSRYPNKQSAYSQPHKTYASGRAQIEDNRVSVLALKIIKQALSCFAILGIIIFMQSRSDMNDALAFIKKHLIETNIEPESLYDGIKNIILQCSRALGGAP